MHVFIIKSMYCATDPENREPKPSEVNLSGWVTVRQDQPNAHHGNRQVLPYQGEYRQYQGGRFQR